MNKDDITQHPYISCVEAYYAAWLSEFTDVRKLYVTGFAEIVQVIKDFASGSTYANYYKIPRLQDVGESLGITTHTKQTKFFISNGLSLVKIKDTLFGGTLTPWREDHYIAVERSKSGTYTYVNHYPLSCGVLMQEELMKGFDGVTLTFTYTGKCNEKLYGEYREQAFAKMKADMPQAQFCDLVGTQLRDAVGILKASRRRTYLWLLSEGYNFSALQEQVAQLQKLYFRIGADIQRGKKDRDYSESRESILKAEKEWRELL